MAIAVAVAAAHVAFRPNKNVLHLDFCFLLFYGSFMVGRTAIGRGMQITTI